MRSRAYGPNWPRCAPIWRFCSTPTCRTGLRSKPIAARPALTATGRPARNPRAGSPPAGSTPKTARTWRRTPRKTRSSTCLPNRIRPRPTGRRNRVTAVRTADLRRQRKTGCAIAWRSRRARGHHRQRHRSPRLSRSRSPHPSPNSLGRHRNRSAHPPRRPKCHRRRPPSRSRSRRRRSPSQPRAVAPEPSRSRRRRSPSPNRSRRRRPRSRNGSRRRRRIGSLRPPRESGYPRAHRAATGCRLPCQIRRLSRRARTGPRANMSARGGHPSRRCSLRSPTFAAGATQLRRTPSILDARRRHRRWPPSPGAPRHTPSPSRHPNRHLPCAAGGAATPQHGGHRRAVGCRAAGEASGHPDRRRPSQAPRRVS